MPEDKQNDESNDDDGAAEEMDPVADADEVEEDTAEEVEESAETGEDAEVESDEVKESVADEETEGEDETATLEAGGEGVTTQADDQSHSKPEKGPDEAYCSSCGSVIKKEAEICPECGVRQESTSPSQEKNPVLAAILSFLIPGAGQIYNGQIARGAIFLVVFFINILLAFVLIGVLTQLITVVIAVYDAYNQAEKINAGEVQV